MSCSICGGPRVDNLVRHRWECPCYRDTFRTVVDREAGVESLRRHPGLARLEALLDTWYPDEGARPPDQGAA